MSESTTRPVPATATWAGPVVETWLTTLTPVADLPAALRQHRLAALLQHAGPTEVRQAYRDRAGRYVVVLDGPSMRAEWPRDPAVAATWSDRTVLAADRPAPGGAAGPLLALTEEPDGAVRADPFPAALVDGNPLRFEFGDRPGPVRHLMRLLLALALEPGAAEFATRPFVFDALTESPGTTLWPALTAPVNELRLPWPTIRALAATDIARIRRLLSADAPTVYQYFAILDGARLHQVVRRSATPEGYDIEEHLARDGAWTRSFLITEITIGKSDHDYRRLAPDEVDHHLETIRARPVNRGGSR